MSSPSLREADRWYRQAVVDLKAARWNREGEFFAQACFLAQQAGEKALKASLYFLGSRRHALMTHSLVEMTTLLQKEDGALGERLDDARNLDLHYVPSRYPNGLPSGYPHQFYAKPQADAAVSAAERILTAVAAFLAARGGQEIVTDESTTPGPPGETTDTTTER